MNGSENAATEGDTNKWRISVFEDRSDRRSQTGIIEMSTWAQAGISSLKLSTGLREILQCLEKATTRAFSLLNVSRHYAKWTYEYGN